MSIFGSSDSGGLFGLKDTGFGNFIGDVGNFLNDAVDVVSDLPNRIIDAGIWLGDKQNEALTGAGNTIKDNQTEFQTRKAGLGIVDILKENPLLSAGIAGLLIWLITK